MIPQTPRRRFLPVLSVAVFAACSQPPKNAGVPLRTYQLVGVVQRLYPERQTALIQHEEIAGWMEAMTMEFPVRDKAEFEKLAEDKRIRATVHVQDLDYWLTDIRDAGQ